MPSSADDRVILAIDQGTTSTRVILFSREGSILGKSSLELKQHFPRDGWVEHDVGGPRVPDAR
jgi:glycerol kinase